MPRQSITLSEPNDEWLSAQVDSREFASKSEVVNDLIRRAREIEMIRARLIASEMRLAQEGPLNMTREQILDDLRKETRRDGTADP